MRALNTKGEWCAGVGGGIASFNGRVLAQPAGGTCFKDDDHVIYQVCDGNGCRNVLHNVRDDSKVVVDATGSSSISADGGVWVLWGGLTKLGVRDSLGRTWPDAGMCPSSVGPDGDIALKNSYQSYGPWTVYKQDGRTWQLQPGTSPQQADASDLGHDVNDLCLLGNNRASFTIHGEPQVVGDVPLCNPVTRPFWWLRLVETPLGWFALYQEAGGRLFLQKIGTTQGYVVAPGPNTFEPDARLVGNIIFVRYATNQGETPDSVVNQPVDLATPMIDLSALVQTHVPTYPKFNQAMLSGYFYQYSDQYGDNQSAPGNCTVLVEPNVWKRVPISVQLICSTNALPDTLDRVAALWVSAEDVNSLETAAAAVKAQYPSIPVLGYIDGRNWTRVPKNVDWFGIQTYCLKGESVAAFQQAIQSLIAQLEPFGKIALITQNYDTNASLTGDLVPLQNIYQQLAYKNTSVIAALRFSDGRSIAGTTTGGTRVHPELYPWHRAFDAAIIGAPEIQRVNAAPTITILSYDKTVTVGQPVYAVAQLGGGPATTIQWLYRQQGHHAWLTAALNPATDTDHHFTFSNVAGVYEIAAAVAGPGGNAQTGVIRLVTVVAAPIPAPAPTPEPTPEPTPTPAPTPLPTPKKSWWQKVLAFFGL